MQIAPLHRGAALQRHVDAQTVQGLRRLESAQVAQSRPRRRRERAPDDHPHDGRGLSLLTIVHRLQSFTPHLSCFKASILPLMPPR
jgi:hypothetical protein